MNQTTKQPTNVSIDAEHYAPMALLAVLLVMITVGYWNTLARAIASWNDPRYSHGYLIPFIALVMLWVRREPIGEVSPKWRWYGVGLIAGGQLLRIVSSYLAIVYFDMLSYVACVAGAVMLVGGRKTIRWAGAPIAFLIFMFPLPQLATRMLHVPLQKIATIFSTYCFQTIGLSAFREGNKIVLGNDNVRLEVVDACIGLRMLTIFIALAVAIALVIHRPLWQRLLLIFSAVPIAVLVNVIRITVTGLLHVEAGDVIADWVFHDWAGYFMMPMALALLYAEAQLLARLFVEDDTPRHHISFGAHAR